MVFGALYVYLHLLGTPEVHNVLDWNLDNFQNIAVRRLMSPYVTLRCLKAGTHYSHVT